VTSAVTAVMSTVTITVTLTAIVAETERRDAYLIRT
jgi:hypothetical protein